METTPDWPEWEFKPLKWSPRIKPSCTQIPAYVFILDFFVSWVLFSKRYSVLSITAELYGFAIELWQLFLIRGDFLCTAAQCLFHGCWKPSSCRRKPRYFQREAFKFESVAVSATSESSGLFIQTLEMLPSGVVSGKKQNMLANCWCFLEETGGRKRPIKSYGRGEKVPNTSRANHLLTLMLSLFTRNIDDAQ